MVRSGLVALHGTASSASSPSVSRASWTDMRGRRKDGPQRTQGYPRESLHRPNKDSSSAQDVFDAPNAVVLMSGAESGSSAGVCVWHWYRTTGTVSSLVDHQLPGSPWTQWGEMPCGRSSPWPHYRSGYHHYGPVGSIAAQRSTVQWRRTSHHRGQLGAFTGYLARSGIKTRGQDMHM